jgi:hypothetical protein
MQSSLVGVGAEAGPVANWKSGNSTPRLNRLRRLDADDWLAWAADNGYELIYPSRMT